jgi:hypothetical protein
MLGGSPRQRAATLAREDGAPEEAIAAMLTEPEEESPRSVLFYVDRIRAHAALARLPFASRTYVTIASPVPWK